MNITTKRDTPFPNSSSTPCDDPNYLKENIITQEESGIKVPINQPGTPLTEFAERLIALEQENVALREELEQLKEVVSITLSLAGHTFPLLSQYYGRRVLTDEAEKRVRDRLWDWAKDHGLEFIPFELSPDGGLKIIKDKEDDNRDGEGEN